MATRTWIGTTGDWNTTGNWAEGSVPVTGDDVYFSSNAQAVTTNLNQSSVTLASLNIDSSYTGTFGTSSSYLQISASVVSIGQASPSGIVGTGSGRLNINLGSVATVITVLSSAANGLDLGLTPVRLLGSSITSLNISSGKVGVAVKAGETATVTSLHVGQGSPSVFVGSSAAVTTITIASGVVVSNSSSTVTTAEITGGQYTNQGSGATTTLNVYGGQCLYNGQGTITNAYVIGTLDFSKDPRAKTVTHCYLFKGGVVNTSNSAITFTNGISLQHCGLADVTINAGNNFTVSIS